MSGVVGCGGMWGDGGVVSRGGKRGKGREYMGWGVWREREREWR